MIHLTPIDKPIASWLFEKSSPLKMEEKEGDNYVGIIEGICQVLHRNRLFEAPQVWSQTIENPILQKITSCLTISELLSEIRRLVINSIPLLLQLRLGAEIQTSIGNWISCRNATSVNFYSPFLVEVSTHLDIWLQFDLEGCPQKEVFELNRGRWSRMLSSIRNELQLDLETGISEGSFVKKKGLNIENLVDIDGKIEDVSDFFGAEIIFR